MIAALFFQNGSVTQESFMLKFPRGLSLVCMIAGFLSIGASIAIWAIGKGDDRAHAERFGIFVGLWAPTFMSLGMWLQLMGRGGKQSVLPPSVGQ